MIVLVKIISIVISLNKKLFKLIHSYVRWQLKWQDMFSIELN